MSKQSFTRKVLVGLPSKAVNVLAGGNAIDTLRKYRNPTIKRALKKLVDQHDGFVKHKDLAKAVKASGNRNALYAYKKERLKTGLARGTVASAVAYKALKNKQQQQQNGSAY